MSGESDENTPISLGAGASREDTIVAQATPPGRGALAIVRLSGAGAARVWSACFRAAETDRVPERAPRHAGYGRWIAPASGATIDEVVATWFEAPHTYTGEPLVEIACHGSNLLVARIIESCVAAGARLARPGEFTERAFLNGRVDLSRAQAVVELIDAATRTAQRHALVRLRGGLEREIHAAEESMLDAAALIEAYLDFPEEDLGAEDRTAAATQLADADARLERLLATAHRGRLESQGARVVLAGEPNVGKSSLFNALVGRARALVTDVPGTTRDVIDARLDIGGVPVTLLDTAGLRETADEVELLGVGRTHEELGDADYALWLFDASAPIGPAALDHLAKYLAAPLPEGELEGAEAHEAAVAPDPRENRRVVLVLNKCDRAAAPALADRRAQLAPFAHATLAMIELSAKNPESLRPLLQLLDRLLLGADPERAATTAPDEVVVADTEQIERLAAARSALLRARTAFEREASGELVMVDLQEALDILADLTGTTVTEEKLDRVFRRFCLGK